MLFWLECFFSVHIWRRHPVSSTDHNTAFLPEWNLKQEVPIAIMLFDAWTLSAWRSGRARFVPFYYWTRLYDFCRERHYRDRSFFSQQISWRAISDPAFQSLRWSFIPSSHTNHSLRHLLFLEIPDFHLRTPWAVTFVYLFSVYKTKSHCV